MKLRRRTLPAVLLATASVAMLATTGCAKASDVGEDGAVHAIASFYPLEYVTERIGGEHVAVTGLTKPGAEPHDLELTPRQTGSLSEADVVVYLEGLQPAVDQAIRQAKPSHVAEAGVLAGLDKHQAEPEEEGHGHEEDEHGHEEEGHDHPGGDPHFWLDPTLLARAADGIGDKLAKADPKHAGEYRANTARLVKDLGVLHGELQDTLGGAKNRTFITAHAAFGYLAERYDLEQHGISGLDPESEPSPARLAELQRTAKREKVTTIFFETTASPKTAKALAGDLGLKTAVLDPLEGVKDPAKDDYFSVMRQNLKNLKAALGAT